MLSFLGCKTPSEYVRHQIQNNLTGDFIYQTSSLTTMRAIFSSFFRRDLRRGPFVLTLTDLHQSNIFVDENWHITSLIDLEGACSLPIEILHPPYWLTGMAVDSIEPCEHNNSRSEFMDILAVEEKRDDRKGYSPFNFKLSEIMNSAWDNEPCSIEPYWTIRNLR